MLPHGVANPARGVGSRPIAGVRWPDDLLDHQQSSAVVSTTTGEFRHGRAAV